MKLAALSILTGLLAIAAEGQTAQDPFTWAPVNPPLTAARADACAAALPDGSAIVTGGVGTDGNALASVDQFTISGGMSPAPPMNNPRTAHSCTVLADGRILAAGGNDGHGFPTGTAEIFDPAAQSWTAVGALNEPRFGHTAVLLNNGRVLIAGGQDVNGAKDTLEIFNPKTGAFVALGSRLSSPRMNHAAALLSDGRVLILGGSNGVSSLASVDSYDPAKHVVLAGAPILSARASLSANTLADGTVLVAGGWDGTQDLDSAEIYDVHRGSTPVSGKLNTARHGQFALMLPGNGNVLLGGGMSGTSVLATTEVFNPEDGTFSVVGSLNSPRARATAVPVGQGMVLSAGGVSTDAVTPVVACGVLASPSIAWSLVGLDNFHGPPFTGSLLIAGSNFPAGKSIIISLSVKESSGASESFQNLAVSNSGNGSFAITTGNLPGADSGMWKVTVVSERTSGPNSNVPNTASLTQPIIFANITPAVRNCNPCDPLVTVFATATVTNAQPMLIDGSPQQGDSLSFVFDGNPMPVRGLFSHAANLATATVKLPPGNHSVAVFMRGNADGFTGNSDPVPFTVGRFPMQLMISANPNPLLTGQDFTLSNMFQSAGTGTPTGLVTYTIVGTGESIPGPLGGVAFFKSLPPGTYTVTGSYPGDSLFQPAVAKITLSVVVAPFIGVVDFNGNWIISNSVTKPNGNGTFIFGDGSSIPVTGDWTGSGHSGVGLFNSGTGAWSLNNRPKGGSVDTFVVFGSPGSTPVTGDWDGNGTTTVGVFQRNGAMWMLRNSNTLGPPDLQFSFGTTSSEPVTGDWDGNGTTTIGTFDPQTAVWELKNKNSAGPPDIVFRFGSPGMIPVTGRWNGGKITGVGVVDPQTGTWMLRNTPSAGAPDFQFRFGPAGTIPISGIQ